MDTTIAIRLLGPVRIARGSVVVRGFESQKAIALLAYLVAHDHPVTRSMLADLFWGSKPESHGRNNLSRVLHNLSALLPGCLVADRHTVRFQRSADCWLDIVAFEELTARGDVDSLLAAAALYRGDFLEGTFLNDCPEFETWLVAEQEVWRQRMAQVLTTVIDYYRRRGLYDQAMQQASRLLSLDPWREEAHRQLMLLLALSGQRSAALAQYEACRRILEEQLGVEPSEETRALYERIRASDVRNPESEHWKPADSTAMALSANSTAIPVHNLPQPMTPFLDRSAEMADLSQMLENPACRLLTLVGPTGVGKSRMALDLAVLLAKSFPGGVFYAPLADVSIEQVATAIGQAVVPDGEGGDSPLSQMKKRLGEGDALLILDNFERVLPAAPLLGQLLAAYPHLKVLAASQVPLHLQVERQFPVTPLAVPDPAHLPDLDTLAHIPSVALFCERAVAVQPSFRLTADNAIDVATICARLDGLPLAIVLAAPRVKVLPPWAILTRLEPRLKLLTGGAQDLPQRHRSLREAIQWSYELLNEAEQVLFRRLAVFVHACTLEAVEAICNADESLQIDVFDGVASLVDRSLLERVQQEDGQIYFCMLATIREYALECLAASGEMAAMQRQRAEYFLRRVRAGWTNSSQECYQGCPDWMLENLWAAHSWALAQGDEALADEVASAIQEMEALTVRVAVGELRPQAHRHAR